MQRLDGWLFVGEGRCCSVPLTSFEGSNSEKISLLLFSLAQVLEEAQVSLLNFFVTHPVCSISAENSTPCFTCVG